MTSDKSRARRRLAWAAVLAVLVGSTGGTALTTPVAQADTVTVPYVDRLGCGTSDAAVTPVFGWSGSGTAANGAGYTATTTASGYPATSGVFSEVAGGQAYTVYAPLGYGSSYQYRGTYGLGFPDVQAGRAATLTMTLPHAQAVQFTLGGMQSPTRVIVSGSGPDGTVTAAAAARGTAPTDARAAQSGASVIATGATVVTSDATPGNAVDVWFPRPVDRLTLRIEPTAGGTEAGFLITAPVACQAGAVTTEAAVSAPTVDAASGRVRYDVNLTTSVSNDSPTSGAALHPTVTAALAPALSAQGITLDSVEAVSASAEACTAAPGLDGSGPLMDTAAGFLRPGQGCTLDWVASVSMPQSAASRTVDLASILRSSTTDAARQKSAASTPIVFPGLVSDLAVTDTGATSALPGGRIARTATVVNNGQGAALGATLRIDLPPGFTATGFPGSCTLNGAALECTVPALNPGASARVPYTLVLPASAAPGSSHRVSDTASASSQDGAATTAYSITVSAPPAPAPVVPPGPGTSPAPRPSPSPAPTRSPAPAPPASPAPSVPADPPPADDAPSPLPMEVRLGAAELVPGTVAAMRGTIGPNATDDPVELTLSGRVNQGLVYRSVSVVIGGEAYECEASAREFTCVFTLEPGESATLEIRLFTDELNAPDMAVQQLSTASDSEPANAVTVTTSVQSEASDTDEWKAAFTMDMSSMPAAFLPLLAMMLYALAATVVERRRDRN